MTGGGGAPGRVFAPRPGIAGEEPEAYRHAVGREPSPDRMIEIMPIDQLVEGLLHAPALAVAGRELPRPEPLDAGHIHPGPAPIGRRAGLQGDQLQARVPVAVPEP